MISLPRICEVLHNWFGYPTRPHNFAIGPKENPYMLRWWIIPRNSIFNVFLHVIKHDDDDRALHDHPWWSVSFCLLGGLTEFYEKDGKIISRAIESGNVVFRNGKNPHRLELRSVFAKTLFITGPRFREWGFHCPQGWRPWYEFTKPGSKGEIGKGCGD